MNKKRNQHVKYLLITLLPAIWGCSTPATQPTQPADRDPKSSNSDEMHKLVTELNLRIQALETKLSSLNDKFDSTKVALNQAITGQEVKTR